MTFGLSVHVNAQPVEVDETMLLSLNQPAVVCNNAVQYCHDNIEQRGQHNMAELCFHRLQTGAKVVIM